ncbi:hypothetical protein COHA_008832 [Chlorella ohadii]|uniref:Uncharacterized protein n=1 Tax=Chlorella ohadii TaxID=2649997 RepID=A0AAD5DFZ7_9CHLO|nr:hypothetical protein COHA_008832 [Chlorella ohadii]
MRESQQVEERVIYVTNRREWEAEVAKAGDKLVVLEIQSQIVCQSGFEEEPELQWKEDRKRAMEPCSGLKHTFARTARECKDVVFLSLEVGGWVGGEDEWAGGQR